MKCVFTVLVLICLTGTSATLVRSASNVRSPVEKVVQLLEELRTKIQDDGKSETRTYDEFGCWCKQTQARKSDAISDAKKQISTLSEAISQFKLTISLLEGDISKLTENIEDNQAAQDEATVLRQKQNVEYSAETAEMKQALAALEKAIKVLHGATPTTSLLQQRTTMSSGVKNVLNVLLRAENIKPKHLALVNELAVAGDRVTYAPQSETVRGILEEMYSTFSADLMVSTQMEAEQSQRFEAFISTKQKEALALRNNRVKKNNEKANKEASLAESLHLFDDTESEMQATTGFLKETVASCEAKFAAWNTRKTLRQKELAGIIKAIEIISTDDAREIFNSAIKPGVEIVANDEDKASFFQTSRLESLNGQKHASEKLRAVAVLTGNLHIAQLAAQVREMKSGHFDEVIAAIDRMIADLKAENLDDIKKRDDCVEVYRQIKSTVSRLNWTVRKNDNTIAQHNRVVDKFAEKRVRATSQLEDTRKEIHAMVQQRENDKAAFVKAKTEDEKAIHILSTAKTWLLKYYEENDIELGPVRFAFQQREFDVPADQAPRTPLSDKGSRRLETRGIVTIMTSILDDLKDELANEIRDESAAKMDFEKQHKTAQALEAKLVTTLASLADDTANTKGALAEEDARKTENMEDIAEQLEYKKMVSSDCDWLISKFDERAEKRTSEMDGLSQAKEFLAGYKPPEPEVEEAALVQTKRSLHIVSQHNKK